MRQEILNHRRILTTRAVILLLLIATLSASIGYTTQTNANNRFGHNGHWARSGGVAQMTFVDTTGPHWPVFNKHQDWDRADRIDVNYSGGACGMHCVRVEVILPQNDPDFDENCFVAGKSNAAFPGQVGGGNHYFDSVHVKFNRACNDRISDFRRAIVTCHEMGHALGLSHFPPTRADCMWQFYDQATSLESSGHDRQTMLDQTIYDH